MRREKRVPMSMFTYYLDASIQNAYTLLQSIVVPGEVTYSVSEYKRRVAVQLVQPLIDQKLRRYSLRNVASSSLVEVNSGVHVELAGMESHMIFENRGRKSTPCYVCKFVDANLKAKWTTFGCTDCKTGFHVNCFTFFHRRKEIREKKRDVHGVILSVEANMNNEKRRKRNVKCITDLESCKIPWHDTKDGDGDA